MMRNPVRRYLSPYYIDTYEVTNQRYADGLNWAWGQDARQEDSGSATSSWLQT